MPNYGKYFNTKDGKYYDTDPYGNVITPDKYTYVGKDGKTYVDTRTTKSEVDAVRRRAKEVAAKEAADKKNKAEELLQTKPKMLTSYVNPEDQIDPFTHVSTANELLNGQIRAGVRQGADGFIKNPDIKSKNQYDDPKNLKRQFAYRPKTANNTSLVGQFIQHAANVGYQRSNRFIVFVNGPSNESLFQRLLGVRESHIDFGKRGKRSYLKTEHKKRLAITCQEASLHGKALMTEDYNNTGNGPDMRHAYGENYSGDLTLSFLCSSDFFERMYFENWMEKIVNPGTHEVALYEDYAQPWSIVVAVLPADMDSTDNRGASMEEVAAKVYARNSRDIYFVRYDHVYPYRINNQDLSSGTNNEILKFSVQFKYHRWYDPVMRYRQDLEYKRQNLARLPTTEEVRVRDTLREPELEQSSFIVPASFVPVQRTQEFSPYLPITDSLNAAGDLASSDELSPFDKFKKVARDVMRYSNPQEWKGLIVNNGLEQLGGIIGDGTVESVAQAGQVVDVYIKTPSKNIMNTSNKLLGPLGNIL